MFFDGVRSRSRVKGWVSIDVGLVVGVTAALLMVSGLGVYAVASSWFGESGHRGHRQRGASQDAGRDNQGNHNGWQDGHDHGGGDNGGRDGWHSNHGHGDQNDGRGGHGHGNHEGWSGGHGGNDSGGRDDHGNGGGTEAPGQGGGTPSNTQLNADENPWFDGNATCQADSKDVRHQHFNSYQTTRR